MATKSLGRDPALKRLECCNCRVELGAPAGVVPFHTDDKEVWCPQCFVWKRAPQEPGRYDANAMRALKCAGATSCGLVTVSFGGASACPQCTCPIVVELGPKAVG